MSVSKLFLLFLVDKGDRHCFDGYRGGEACVDVVSGTEGDITEGDNLCFARALCL